MIKIKEKKEEWVEASLKDLSLEAENTKKKGGKIHPLQLALDVQEAMGERLAGN